MSGGGGGSGIQLEHSGRLLVPGECDRLQATLPAEPCFHDGAVLQDTTLDAHAARSLAAC